MRVAIIYEWLASITGGERVLEDLLLLYPQAHVYVLLDMIAEQDRGFLKDADIRTSFLQNLPFVRHYYRKLLPFMPLAVESLDVGDYDVIISSSHAVAKGVITRAEQAHICYCHTPIRYAWDLQHQYLRQANMSGVSRLLSGLILNYIRLWDLRTINGVDHFVANSKFIAARIRKVYRRHSEVIYPPADTAKFGLSSQRDRYFLTVSRLVPYKRVDVIVEAFQSLPDLKLVVVGDGPEFKKCKALAGRNVEFLPYQAEEQLVQLYRKAEGFIFAAEEDFGIAVVEAQSCGTPVICLNRGGARETVLPGVTGVTFPVQTADAVLQAMRNFQAHGPWDPQAIRSNALRFGRERFRMEMQNAVESSIRRVRARNDWT